MSRYTRELLEAHPDASELEIVRLAWPDCPRALEDRERARVRRARLDLLPVLLAERAATKRQMDMERWGHFHRSQRDGAAMFWLAALLGVEQADAWVVPDREWARIEAAVRALQTDVQRLTEQRDKALAERDDARGTANAITEQLMRSCVLPGNPCYQDPVQWAGVVADAVKQALADQDELRYRLASLEAEHGEAMLGLAQARQQHGTARRELAEVRQALETCGVQLRETQMALQQARQALTLVKEVK
jgi:hypothetical protein